MTQLAAVICCFRDRGWRTGKKKDKKRKTLTRHIVFCAFWLFFFPCPPVMVAIRRDEPLCSGAPTEWPLWRDEVGAGQTAKGTEWEGTDCGRRGGRGRRSRGGTDATKGTRESGWKETTGRREAA